MSYQYKNVTDVTLSLPGIGSVAAGEVIETDVPFENPNFEEVGGSAPQPTETPEAPAQPQAEEQRPDTATDLGGIN